jgi:hypothetical protein
MVDVATEDPQKSSPTRPMRRVSSSSTSLTAMGFDIKEIEGNGNQDAPLDLLAAGDEGTLEYRLQVCPRVLHFPPSIPLCLADETSPVPANLLSEISTS